MQHTDELKETIEFLLAKYGMHEIEQNLESEGFVAVYVMRIEEALEDEHLFARNIVINLGALGV